MSDTENKAQDEQNVKTEETVQNDAQNEATGQTEEAAAEKKEPTAEDRIAELEKANAELKDQFLRKSADFDNYRKRMIREKQEAYDYANTNLLTDLIATLDDFDRALAAGQEVDGKTPDLKPVVDGIKMINKQLRGLLEAKYNLSTYGENGDAFNPDIHEAIATANAPVADPTCAEVYLKGYKLKDRVIRPAKVMVHMPDGSVKSEEKAEEATN